MKKNFLICCLLLLSFSFGMAEDTAPKKHWTLQQCINYALENNISLQLKRNVFLSGVEDTKQAKAAVYPSLSASTAQKFSETFAGENSGSGYAASYGVNSDMTLYEGGKLRRAVKISTVQNAIDSIGVEQSIVDLKIDIITAFIRCIYADDAIEIQENSLKLSQAERDRAVEMFKAGSISKVDVAQLESQVYSDKYDLVTAQKTHNDYLLDLKSLLELQITDEMELVRIEVDDSVIMDSIDSKVKIYENALDFLPEVRSSEKAIESAELSVRQAKAGYIPTIGLSAGLGTANQTGTGNNFSKQITDNFSLDAGLTLNIPISQNRKVKTDVNKAMINLTNSRLEKRDVETEVMEKVENSYLGVITAQSQYKSALEKREYAQQSYDLTEQQFNLGMKNTIDLIAAMNDLLSAKQSVLQAKYIVLLNMTILNIYQGIY